MQSDGVIGRYAIGGAVGALLYLEPADTADVDIFVDLPASPGSALVNVAPIFDYLVTRGYKTKADAIVIGDWPVQFLPSSNALLSEALQEAIETDVEGVKTRVMRAEHLAAIALQTGRTKDYIRIVHFIEQNALDRDKLTRIITNHGLQSKWQEFAKKYL